MKVIAGILIFQPENVELNYARKIQKNFDSPSMSRLKLSLTVMRIDI